MPVWGDIDTVIHLRIAVVPKRWPACRGDGWRLGLHTDVLQDRPDIGTVRDERDDAHLTTADRAYQRKNPVDAGDQHCPQVVRRWAHCAVWRSSRPDRYPLCEGAPWQRVGGRSPSAAAPGQRGRVPGCTHRHPPRSRCAGRPACLWRHSSAAQESKGQVLNYEIANQLHNPTQARVVHLVHVDHHPGDDQPAHQFCSDLPLQAHC